MKKLIVSAAVAGVAAVSMPTAASAQCGEVTVGAANWSTAEIIANIDAFILTEGYGCTVTLTPTSTTQTLALAQGAANPLIVPEFWANGVDQEVLASMISNGDINIDSRPFPEAGEFWYVSAAFAEAYPELDTVEKVLERPDLFPSSTNEGTGSFFGCPIGIGWGCEHSNTNLFKGYGMEDMGWTLENPGSFEGMNSIITDAYLTDGNWFGYYWTPTAVAIENGLVALSHEAEFVGGEIWGNCYATPDPAADCEHVPSSYTPSNVVSLVTPAMMETGAAGDYAMAREMPMAALGAADAYMGANSASAMDTAKHFLANNEDIWTAWVSEDAADAIRAAL